MTLKKVPWKRIKNYSVQFKPMVEVLEKPEQLDASNKNKILSRENREYLHSITASGFRKI
mgnify:CR=1 FL=1